ncbi:heme exporter protein CcmD [Pelomonas sp. HMWF004]|nr:heme exporter protein CcmD [Pelomonas sp. HMWF004]
MHWNSLSDFFLMGGYAFYVWGSVGACAVAMGLEPWLIRRQRQAVLQSLRDQLDAQATEPDRQAPRS